MFRQKFPFQSCLTASVYATATASHHQEQAYPPPILNLARSLPSTNCSIREHIVEMHHSFAQVGLYPLRQPIDNGIASGVVDTVGVSGVVGFICN